MECSAQLALSAQLEGRLERLRVLPFDITDGAEDISETLEALLADSAMQKQLDILVAVGAVHPLSGSLIFEHCLTSAARDLLRAFVPTIANATSVRVHAVAPFDSSSHMPVLQQAIARWFLRTVVSSGWLPLANEQMLDTTPLSRTPNRSLGPMEAAATMRLVALEPHSHPAASMEIDLFEEDDLRTRAATVTLAFEGLEVRAGTLGFDPLSVLCSDARAELQMTGQVELNGHRFWRAYDPESEDGPRAIVRLLPDLRLVRILAVYSSVPPPAAAGEVAATDAVPARAMSAEEYRRLWGARFGMWLSPEQASGPYARVVDEHGHWLVAPLAAMWPSAGTRAVRQHATAAASWPAALQRIVQALEAHAPLPSLRLRLDHTGAGTSSYASANPFAVSRADADGHSTAEAGRSWATAQVHANLQPRRITASQPSSPPPSSPPLPVQLATAPVHTPITSVPSWAKPFRRSTLGKRPLGSVVLATGARSPAPSSHKSRFVAPSASSLVTPSAIAVSAKAQLQLQPPRSTLQQPQPHRSTPPQPLSQLQPRRPTPTAPASSGASSSATAVSAAQLQHLKNAELKLRCKELGLPISGNKDALITRIVESTRTAAPLPARRPPPLAFKPLTAPVASRPPDTAPVLQFIVPPRGSPQPPSSNAPLTAKRPPKPSRPPKPAPAKPSRPRISFADSLVSLVKEYQPVRARPVAPIAPAAWPGDSPEAWVKAGALTTAALKLVRAIVDAYSDVEHDWEPCLSVAALNAYTLPLCSNATHAAHCSRLPTLHAAPSPPSSERATAFAVMQHQREDGRGGARERRRRVPSRLQRRAEDASWASECRCVRRLRHSVAG